MKKGFTLVELAIVLVVIGLLMGMAFKGKSLVDAARIKAEVNKVTKIGTAIHSYYAKYGALPGQTGNGNNITFTNQRMYNELIDQGMLKEGDFKSAGAGNAGGGSYWNFVGCEEGRSQQGNWWKVSSVNNNKNLCLYRSYVHPKDNVADLPNNPGQTAGGDISPAMDAQTLCHIETLLDDKNMRTGDARTTMQSGNVFSANGGEVTINPGGWNCLDKTVFNAKDFMYAIRIF